MQRVQEPLTDTMSVGLTEDIQLYVVGSFNAEREGLSENSKRFRQATRHRDGVVDTKRCVTLVMAWDP